VHFTGPQWAGADEIPAARPNHVIQEMLTHSGSTLVVVTADSDLSNTVALRRRIESGGALGPRGLLAIDVAQTQRFPGWSRRLTRNDI
jgi:hypothetical protein